MKCKTSFFNPTVSRNLLRRYWPFGVGSLILWLLLFLTILQSSLSGFRSELWDSVDQIIYQMSDVPLVCFMPAAFIGAALCLHHLHNRTELQFFLGLPLKRRCIYLTAVLTGFFSLLIPFFVTLLVGVFMALPYDISPLSFLALAGIGTAELTIYYSMAVLCCVLAGNLVGSLLLYLGAHGFLSLMVHGFMQLASFYIKGMEGVSLPAFSHWLTPVSGLSTCISVHVENGVPVLQNTTALVIYGLVGLVLLVLGGLLYQRRHAENTGNTLAFWWLHGPAKIFGASAITMCALMLVWLFGSEDIRSFPATLILVAVFSLLGWFAADMIVRKTLRVFGKRSMLCCGVFALAALLVLVGIRADIPGVATHVPSVGSLEPEAEVNVNFNGSTLLPTEDVILLHQTIVDNLDLAAEPSMDTYDMDRIYICYTRTDGMAVERSYYFEELLNPDSGNPITEVLREITRKNDSIYSLVFGTGRDNLITEKSLISAFLFSIQGGMDNCYFAFPEEGDNRLTPEQALTLYDAILEDMDAGRILTRGYYGDHNTLLEISFNWFSYNQPGSPTLNSTVCVNRYMTSTLKALADMGYTPNF